MPKHETAYFWLLVYWLLLLAVAMGSLGAWVGAARRLREVGRPLLLAELNREKPGRRVPWGAGSVGLVVLVYLLIQMVSVPALAELRAAGWLPGPALAVGTELRPTDQLVLMNTINTLSLMVVPLVLRASCQARLKDLGLEDGRQMLSDARLGVRAFLLVTPGIYVAFALAQVVWEAREHVIFETLKGGLDLSLTVLAVVSAVVTAPAAEELLFRGVLLGWLHRVMSRPGDLEFSDPEAAADFGSAPSVRSGWMANGAVSVLFASLHAPQWPAPVPLFLLSLVLGWLYLRTGRLVASWALHAAFNGLSTACVLLLVQADALPEAPIRPRPAGCVMGFDLTAFFGDLGSRQNGRGGVIRPGSGAGLPDPGRRDLFPGRNMDEKGATYLCDLVRTSTLDGEAEPGSARYLIVLKGAVPGSMIPLASGLRTIGRSSDNDIQLPEMSVSRRHATLEIDAEGKVWLVDLGSSNGTFRNGHRLKPGARQTLADGDRVGFGPALLVKFTCPDRCEEQLQRELFERAFRDPLTWLFNRGYFLDQAGNLERQAASLGLGLAVLMLDIDHFKQVNDTFGHDAGDAVLKEVAGVIRSATRADDLVARYGGEEFVVALPIATPDQANERAERIRRLISARRVSVLNRIIKVTASIGVAFASAGRHRPISALVTAADAGLYQAKNAGRDRVVFRGENLDENSGTSTTIDYMTVR